MSFSTRAGIAVHFLTYYSMKGSIDEEEPADPITFVHAAKKRNPMIPTAVREVTAYFVEEESLGPLLTMAFEKKSVGGGEFEREFSILLKEFSKELERDVQGEDQRAAARLVGTYAALISHEIRRIKESDLQEHSTEEVSSHQLNPPQVFVSQCSVTAEEREFSEVDDLQDEDPNRSFNVLDLTALRTSMKSLRNLRHKFSRFVHPDVFQAICSEMSLGLEPLGHQQVTFRVQWELMKFREEELPHHSGLASVLTINGHPKTAYATSCDEYMSRFWPSTGRKTLQTLEAAINCGGEMYGKLVATSLEIECRLTLVKKPSGLVGSDLLSTSAQGSSE